MACEVQQSGWNDTKLPILRIFGVKYAFSPCGICIVSYYLYIIRLIRVYALNRLRVSASATQNPATVYATSTSA